jgi:hypothetical protein
MFGNIVYASGVTISGGEITLDPTQHSTASGTDPEKAEKTLGEKIIELANMFVWIAVAFSLIGFAYAATRLAVSTGNPRRKEEAQRGMLVCFICLILLGSIKFILSLAVGAFR